MSINYYILIDDVPTPTNDPLLWINSDRSVKIDNVGDVRISTVFLGISISYINIKPVLFETMVFGGEFDGYQDRYVSLDDALEGHKKIYEMVDHKRIERDQKINNILN